MKEMFVIIDGEYSDWNIIGYTDDEDEAMQLCAQHNEKADWSGEEWYYESCDRVKTPEQRVKLKYVYIIRFYRKNDGYHMDDDFRIEYHTESSKKGAEKVEVKKLPSFIDISVPLKENNRERAEKIAQDALYKYLSERQGL